MTQVKLLEDLKQLCKEAVKNMELPVQMQKGDTKAQSKVPDVYKMRLPHSDSAKKYVPYIIIQALSGKHVQANGERPRYTVNVRFVFAVYGEDEQEGSLMLMNLMDRVQYALLKQVQVGAEFLLDVHSALETLIYPDDTAPFYAGEMAGTFYLPPIEREVWNEKKRF
ncbi:MAG: hypothetical protein NC203_00350 [Firmicutes bacterium]|nr:hypothetical protein [[Eubacterium] siraeum]MCM1486789.1 hypothetical protein [Bacillota bacterium]